MAPKTDASTRAPAGHARTATEVGGSALLSLWLVTTYGPATMDPTTQSAAAAALIVGFNNLMTMLRNRGWGGFLTGA